MWMQLQAQSIEPDALYLCSGNHSHVGLAVAAKALGIDLRIVGIPYSPRLDDAANARRLAAAANQAAQVLELELDFAPKDIETYVEFTGPQYGVVTEAAQEAIHLTARTEGLFLDPVYTGKAMAGLMAHIREGQFSNDQTVVFVHTGGTPGLFAYHAELGLDV
jgi:D-cysteine desulfhydrase/L-cysteate sulfo-lyase